MKVTVIGLLVKEGTSMKSGTAKPYSIGEIYTMVPFSERDIGAKGFMAMTRKVAPEIIKTIQHNTLPFHAEIEVRDVINFGKPELEVTAIKPIAAQEKLKAA